ncbi:MAG: hypothetical protein H6935_01850 [Thiobacillus sp.]|nr:hypothetical protein [Thiobacillus sp.]
MKRRIALFVLIPAFLAALLLALRQDLASLAQRKVEQHLRAGEMERARTALLQAAALGVDAASLRYNLGVTYYRNGQYAPAQREFDAAMAQAGPKLMPALLYNRGNSLFRQAEQAASRDKIAALGLFQAAISDYVKALAMTPEATDVRSNLGLARERVQALGGQQQKEQAPRSGPKQADTREKASGTESRSGAPASPAQSRAEGDPEASKDLSASGRTRKRLGQAEVERMLNDARGRDLPAGTLHGGGDPGRLSRPDRDW